MEVTQLFIGNRAFFRKKFHLASVPCTAVARIFVDTGYELFLNGRFVTHIDEQVNSRDFDVRPFLIAGENTVAVCATNSGGHRGLAFALTADGIYVCTSSFDWKTYPEERWGWMLPDYDDVAWQYAVPIDLSCAGVPQWSTLPGSKYDKVFPFIDNSLFYLGETVKCAESPFYMAEKPKWTPDSAVVAVAGEAYAVFAHRENPKTMHIQSVVRTDGCEECTSHILISQTNRYTGPSFVLDFGCEVVGFLRMRIWSGTAVSFRVFYGETLAQALTEPDRSTLLHRMLVEENILPAGTQEFESRNRIGFRYARVEFFDCATAVTVEGFHLRTSLYPVANRGYFSCNDEMLCRVWEAGRKTLHLCMQEYYLDGIMRDRLLWVGDARNEALYNYYLWGDTKLFEYCWNLMAKCQYPDGAIPSSYGMGLSLIWDYVAWYVIAFHDYYLHTGRVRFLQLHKEDVARAVDFLISKTREDGLIYVPKNPLNTWMVTLNQAEGCDTFMNILYLRALKAAAEIGHACGDSAYEDRYRARADAICDKVEELSVVAPMEDTHANLCNATGLFEIVQHMFDKGDSDEALILIRDKWGAMLSSGADTMYEGFVDAYPTVDDPSENTEFLSSCHGWSAGATMLLLSEVAGIRPLEAGFTRVRVAPKPGFLQSFRAVVPTPVGEIAVAYEKGKPLRVHVPEGICAEITSPDNCGWIIE